ncbi:endonuclease III [bacterium]|jgi:endonuclease III|nr:endonuclease III [bacterium]
MKRSDKTLKKTHHLKKESLSSIKKRASLIFDILVDKFPNASTALDHSNPFELLVATILSAQCTDERINKVTPLLFKTYKTPSELATGNIDDIKSLLKSVNFFNNKAINIKKMANQLLTNFNGEVPNNRDKLTSLAGVGRKTANVVLGQSFNIPGITVDTHVNRLSNRLGFTKNKDAVKAEMDLITIWEDSIWTEFSTVLILHGRASCKARKPLCDTCCISKLCPSKNIVSPVSK